LDSVGLRNFIAGVSRDPVRAKEQLTILFAQLEQQRRTIQELAGGGCAIGDPRGAGRAGEGSVMPSTEMVSNLWRHVACGTIYNVLAKTAKLDLSERSVCEGRWVFVYEGSYDELIARTSPCGLRLLAQGLLQSSAGPVDGGTDLVVYIGCAGITYLRPFKEFCDGRFKPENVTPEQVEETRRSFAYGNVKLSNPDVTREMIDEIADRMEKESEAPAGILGRRNSPGRGALGLPALRCSTARGLGRGGMPSLRGGGRQGGGGECDE
jgi:hypothetical protein